MRSQIYLDYAAATPLDASVLAAMQPYLSGNFYNPSATYAAAQAVAADLQVARQQVAAVLGARATEVIFTAGATESTNLAIQGVMRCHPEARILTSSIEHDAVLVPAGLFRHDIVPVTPQGLVDIDQLVARIQDDTVLVSIMYANNEIGTVQPIRRIGQALEAIRKDRRKAGNALPLYFHTDAAQAANYLDLHVARLSTDLLTLNGGKIYGPKQSGVLYIRSGVKLEPLIYGGGQERGYRSGTENVAASIGFAAALTLAQDGREAETERLKSLQDLALKRIAEKLPTAVINGSRVRRLPNNIHLTLPGVDNERVLFALDEQGIMLAAGSACSASSDEPSHVLRALGLDDAAMQSSLRLTMGRGTTPADIETTIDVLTTLVNR